LLGNDEFNLLTIILTLPSTRGRILPLISGTQHVGFLAF